MAYQFGLSSGQGIRSRDSSGHPGQRRPDSVDATVRRQEFIENNRNQALKLLRQGTPVQFNAVSCPGKIIRKLPSGPAMPLFCQEVIVEQIHEHTTVKPIMRSQPQSAGLKANVFLGE